MNALVSKGALASLIGVLRRVRTRTWVVLGAFLLGLFALLVWAAFALFGALWGGTQGLLQQIGLSGASVEQATAQASAKAQELIENARLKAAGTDLGQVKADVQAMATDAKEGARRQLEHATGVLTPLEQPLQSVKEGLDAAKLASAAAVAAGVATVLPAESVAGANTREVSGEDFGPARFPGMVRTSFVRNGEHLLASFRGPGSMDAVLAHYRREFAAEGYSERVLAAESEREQLAFSRSHEQIGLTVSRAGDSVTVELQR